jgi:hypothetical protein
MKSLPALRFARWGNGWNRELERVLGKRTLEKEILREAVKAANEKLDLALTVLIRRGYAARRVANPSSRIRGVGLG